MTTTTPFGWLVNNPRANGAVTLSDTFTVSDVASSVGGGLGYDTTGVQTSPLNALPLYWNGSDQARSMWRPGR